MIHHYKVSCRRDNLKLIREFVNVVLGDNSNLSEIERNQLILAVDEICANLIIHGHDCNPNDSIEINILDFPERIEFEIVDNDAAQFDLAQYQNPNLRNIIKERRKGGLGLMLVHKIMDRVDVESAPAHNVWRMIKRLRHTQDGAA